MYSQNTYRLIDLLADNRLYSGVLLFYKNLLGGIVQPRIGPTPDILSGTLQDADSGILDM